MAVQLNVQGVDFNDLYEAFAEKVFKVAIKITKDAYLAEDIVQETFIKALSKIDSILDIEKMGAWLSTIASRTAIDLIRKEKRIGMILVDDLLFSDNSKGQNNVETEVEKIWLKEEIVQEILQLKPALKTVFLLKYKDGMKEESIAQHLKLPIGTVKSRLYRARQQIRNEVKLELST
ncbi:RNA polymerase sigma factor [Pseudalkalibacillus berkeleyi]|uniref:RNA polymerase sigma factor n=1 Tax=Pseudalkalibacillus berkeleyi TaxID=1069813 RepID=A0ABS9H214_9BACL|nr:RNA polymerase sigma factor [Pseudalkalibacillus berkeleyi]MCF6137680.1 RNA polymerase sigma factor [Pseudalkalibacillus berkeleyi]